MPKSKAETEVETQVKKRRKPSLIGGHKNPKEKKR